MFRLEINIEVSKTKEWLVNDKSIMPSITIHGSTVFLLAIENSWKKIQMIQNKTLRAVLGFPNWDLSWKLRVDSRRFARLLLFSFTTGFLL